MLLFIYDSHIEYLLYYILVAYDIYQIISYLRATL
jgi:hypothetical protein